MQRLVLCSIPFRPASLDVISVIFSLIAENQWQRGNCAVVLQGPLGSVTGSLEQYGAELQHCLVGNAETAVGRYLDFRIDSAASSILERPRPAQLKALAPE